MFGIPFRQHVFLLRFQHGKLADLVEIAVEAGFTGSNGRQSIAGHKAPLSDLYIGSLFDLAVHAEGEPSGADHSRPRTDPSDR